MKSLHASASRARARGLTLVELLVAVVLMTLVTLATVTLYQVNSQGYRTVDSSQVLDDNARFVFEVIGQSVRNTGFREVVSVSTYSGTTTTGFDNNGLWLFTPCATSAAAALEPCPALGFDNSNLTNPATDTDYGGANRNSPNVSDSLAIRFSGFGEGDKGDGSVVGCTGGSTPSAGNSAAPSTLANMSLNVFWVRNAADGEPELVCTARTFGTNGVVNGRVTQVLARGVESFQVMYGLDANADGIPDRWVGAADVNDWTRVLALRVGLVVRGEAGSSQVRQLGNLYPLGQDFVGSATTAGLVFAPPADYRLRRVYTATFKYRNEL